MVVVSHAIVRDRRSNHLAANCDLSQMTESRSGHPWPHFSKQHASISARGDNLSSRHPGESRGTVTLAPVQAETAIPAQAGTLPL
jgi:hypothetical protein